MNVQTRSQRINKRVKSRKNAPPDDDPFDDRFFLLSLATVDFSFGDFGNTIPNKEKRDSDKK
jgi:hypothetical protein